MNAVDNIGARFDEVLGAALERGASKIGCRKMPRLEHGPHSPIKDQNAGGEGVDKGLVAFLMLVQHSYKYIMIRRYVPGRGRSVHLV
jgi:hypothetical protein